MSRVEYYESSGYDNAPRISARHPRLAMLVRAGL
jgi:hypothetical protein